LTFPGFRVLLAEDSATNRKVIEASLERLELDVESAVNGVEAVEMAAQKYYDLILMDIAMPKMSGLEATRKIRSGEGKSHRSRIIAITANAFEEDKENCIAAGMDDFISKPINIAHFRELASRWLLASRSDQQPEVKTTLIDLEVFNQLFRDTGEKVLPDIFNLFKQECQDRLTTMQDAYESSDWQVIMDQAHALKSSSGSFGAIKLQAFAREMEEAAKSTNPVLMVDLSGRFEQVLEQSLASLTSLIEKIESE
jgi:CheY-like chemotaxis protein